MSACVRACKFQHDVRLLNLEEAQPLFFCFFLKFVQDKMNGRRVRASVPCRGEEIHLHGRTADSVEHVRKLQLQRKKHIVCLIVICELSAAELRQLSYQRSESVRLHGTFEGSAVSASEHGTLLRQRRAPIHDPGRMAVLPNEGDAEG